MSADFSKPLPTQSSDDILQQLKDNIESLTRMSIIGAPGLVDGAIAYHSGEQKFKIKDASSLSGWKELPLILNLSGITSESITSSSIVVTPEYDPLDGTPKPTVKIGGDGEEDAGEGNIYASGTITSTNITSLRADVDSLGQAKLLELRSNSVGNDLSVDLTEVGKTILYVPDASATVRGVLTTADQTIGGIKTLASKKIQLGNSATASNNWHLVGDGYFSISSGNHSSGTERIRIDASGNLGIGITTPSSKLHVAGTARLSPESSGGLIISAGTIDARYTVSNVLDGAAIETLTNHPIIIRTNDVDRVTISRLGNVGVGISLPTSLLHVHSGDIRVSNANNTSTIVSKATDRTTISSNTTTNNVVIMDSGSVGVSTAYDPTTYGKFVVGSNTTDASTKNMISMVNASNTDNVALRIAGYNHPESRLQTAIDFIQNSNTNDKSYITFSTHDGSTISEKVRITAEGSLGIGTSGPLAKLHIFDSSVTPYVLVQGQSSTSTPAGSDKSGVLLDVNGKGAFSITNDASSGSRVLKIDSTNGSFTGTTALTIDSSGNVGVGGVSRATTIPLDVTKNSNSDIWLAVYNSNAGNAANSGLLFGNDTNQYGAQLRFVGSGASMYGGANSFNIIQALNAPVCFYTSNIERFRIDGSGRIGIRTTPLEWNTSATSATLDVAGNFGMMTYASQTYFVQNAYWNSSNQWIRKTAQPCSLYVLGNNGDHLWFSSAPTNGAAGSTFAFSQTLTLNSSGDLSSPGTITSNKIGINEASPVSRLTVTENIAGTAPVNVRVTATNAWSTSNLVLDKADGLAAADGTKNRFVLFRISNNTGSGQINTNGSQQAAFGTASDIRLKQNITNLPPQLENFLKLRPVEFDYKDGSGHQIGFIAQEVEEVYPDLIGRNEDGYLTLTDLNKNDSRLIKAIQELYEELQSVKKRLAELEAK